MVFDLSKENSLLSQFTSELRDVQLQKDRQRFRRNLERIGQILAFEMSKSLEWIEKEITTPLGTAVCNILKEQPVIATIMRAGIPMHQGVLSFFDQADNAFISAYRKHYKDKEGFDIALDYVTSPDLKGRVLVLSDPMLASGASIVQTIRYLARLGDPKEIHILCAIASKPGLDYVGKELPEVKIWAAAVDPHLNTHSYIVPGLGDAGDLAFGPKIQS